MVPQGTRLSQDAISQLLMGLIKHTDKVCVVAPVGKEGFRKAAIVGSVHKMFEYFQDKPNFQECSMVSFFNDRKIPYHVMKDIAS